MTWIIALAVIFGGLMLALLVGLPVAFSFMVVNIAGLYWFLGGATGWELLPGSVYEAGSQFSLTCIPLFILMGDLLMRSGFGTAMIAAADQWIGRVPGRLALTAVGGGVLFGAVSGATMASVAVLGSLLIPEMKRNGYKPPMTVAPILASAGLDALIPPSALAVLLGALAKVSIAELLIAGILPGLVLASAYAVYFWSRAKLQPDLAPSYDVPTVPYRERFKTLIRMSPLVLIMLVVTGFIFLGIATPTETAALGALASALLAAASRRLTWSVVKASVMSTLETTTVILLIIVGSTTYSQLLAATGATSKMIEMATGLDVSPMVMVIIMQAIVFVMGCFIDTISIMLVTIPIFYPIVAALGIDPMWFSVLILIQLQLAGITPPFGVLLFVLNSVRPDFGLATIYRCVAPIVLIQLAVVALIMAYPSIATFLPSLMSR